MCILGSFFVVELQLCHNAQTEIRQLLGPLQLQYVTSQTCLGAKLI